MASKVTKLYQSESLEVSKNSAFPEYLYLIQTDFGVIHLVELDEKDAKALYLILKNRFEA